MAATSRRIARWGGAALGALLGGTAATLASGSVSTVVAATVALGASILVGVTFELLEGRGPVAVCATSAQPQALQPQSVPQAPQPQSVPQPLQPRPQRDTHNWWEARPAQHAARTTQQQAIADAAGNPSERPAPDMVGPMPSNGTARPATTSGTVLADRPRHRPAADGLASYIPSVRLPQCPRCGSLDPKVAGASPTFAFSCERCAHHWRWAAGSPWPAVRIRPAART